MIVVSNASPLIALSTIDLLDTLAKLYGNIHIPQAVNKEVIAAGQGRPGSQEVATAQWIICHAVADQWSVAQLQASTGLDRGESEAIILANELNASLIILDDKDARQYCQTCQLPIIGTVGLLLLAKDDGIIPTIKQPLEALITAGIRVGAVLYSEVLRRAGEL